MNKKVKILLTTIGIGGIIFSISFWITRDYLFQIIYDLRNENSRVDSKKSIDETLEELEKVKFEELDEEYMNYTKSNESRYRKILINSQYYVVKRKDINRRIVGKFRIKNFLSKDKYYKRCLYNKDSHQYWLINKKLLYSILELQEELTNKGYNRNGFRVTYGHRQPRNNEEVNGAKSSKHIKGEAADLVIKDVNKDGKYTNEDKAIILEIVDEKVIGNRGGIGRYPGSRVVHIDVRGKRARWDNY